MINDEKVEFVEGMLARFKQYVIRSTKLYQAMPSTGEAKVFGNQFLIVINLRQSEKKYI